MDLKLAGLGALVCASSKGLGFATARSLAREGCAVFLCARHEEELRQAAVQLREQCHVNIAFAAADLTKKDDCARVCHEAKEQLGRVDILVNNVGGPAPTKAAETTDSQWIQGFEQLFLSAQRMTQALLPGMIEQGFGRIINITSLSVSEPTDNLAISTAMRSAVTANSKTLAREMAPFGVTVNNVMPGVIYTGRIEYLSGQAAKRNHTTVEEELEKKRQHIPMQRLGKPEELADLITFLCSPRAAYITGANIPVDGGSRKAWT